MMQDLKTGHMVGARPIRQQLPQLCVSWVGVGVTMAVLFLLVESNRRNFNGIPIGSGTDMPAPQAMAVQNVVQAVVSGNVPTEKYALGAIIGVLLSLSGLPSLGVLVGLSMYLNFYHILPYGLGCVLHLVLKRVRGRDWHEDVGVPFAAGLLVGEPLVALMFAILTVAGIVGN